MLLQVKKLLPQRGTRYLSPQFFRFLALALDFGVQLLLVLVAVGERGVNLRQREVWVLKVDFFGAPPVGELSSTTSITLVLALVIPAQKKDFFCKQLHHASAARVF